MVRKRVEIEGQLCLDLPMPPTGTAEELEAVRPERKKRTVKAAHADEHVPPPATPVPDLLWQALKNGAGRPGARYAIERAVKDYPPLSYEPIRTAIAVLRDMDTDGIKFRQRGIFVPGHGWFTWTTLLSRVREAVEAGEWMTEPERRKERAACEAEKPKKGWML